MEFSLSLVLITFLFFISQSFPHFQSFFVCAPLSSWSTTLHMHAPLSLQTKLNFDPNFQYE